MEDFNECDSKRITAVSLYRPKFTTGGNVNREGTKPKHTKAFHFVFLVLYLYQTYWCVSTMGEPYRKFLLKADREGFQVMEGSTKMRAQLEYAFSDINNPDRPKEKLGWFDWMQMDIEEHAQRKKREKEQSVLDSLPKHMRVPKTYMPEFVPMLLFGIFVTCHALMILMQHWSVSFNIFLNYRFISSHSLQIPENLLELDEDDFELNDTSSDPLLINDNDKDKLQQSLAQKVYQRAENTPIPSHLPTHAKITPSSGKDVLVPLLYLPTLGLTFEYHRRRYTYDPNTNLWTKIRCQTNMPITFFSTWLGFTSTDQLTASEIRFGKNEFAVRQPTFKELYKAQLLSPFTVFQLFCVILWMLDDYWKYSFYTLLMILTFEATVVFSRIKSLSALKGMGNKPRPVLVYRMGKWLLLDTNSLLPGDLMSLTRVKPHYANQDGSNKGKETKTAASLLGNGREDEFGDIVPADLLLLRGSAVVNEASLTGESVPQIKDGLNELTDDELNMKNLHKTHVLYSGTKMLQCKGIDVIEKEENSSDEEEDAMKAPSSSGCGSFFDSIPRPPDGGALCFVLRTGFSSAQGKLVRMIEGSQEKVKGHERETGLLLLLLFFFAVASSSYVLYHGLQNDKRSQYELLLHCILIITSVIPPELPMQMALAVNNSLMTLMKMQVFCTEPYRVPMAGKLDACLFDKTGTLTTDELVAVGVTEPNALGKINPDGSVALSPMTKVVNEAALVLTGCHSLVLIDGEVTGDPLESAALSSMRWGISQDSGHAIPLPATEKKQAGKNITLSSSSSQISEIEVISRHHFSSKLQRMSCVIRAVKQRTVYAVVKGSSEVIGSLLASKPKGYDETAKALAKQGFRVIAMGYKVLSRHDQIENAKDSRNSCEENIEFAGFIAFTCRVRRDTKMVLTRLKEGGMSIAMVTGDAILTAIHVAKEVGICDADSDDYDLTILEEKNDELKELLIRKADAKKKERPQKPKTMKLILTLEEDTSNGSLFWQSYDDDSRVADYVAKNVPELALKYDLAMTCKSLTAAFEYDDFTKNILAFIKVFARMTPDAKETVIDCLHSVGALCLMCGDGANDVGALREADVGVALLSGFGDLNVDKGEDGNKKEDKEAMDIPLTSIIPPQRVQAIKSMPAAIIKGQIRALGVDPNRYPDLVEKEDLFKLFEIKAKEKYVMMQKNNKEGAKKKLTMNEMKTKHKNETAEKQRKMLERVKELEAQGEAWPQVKAMKEFWAAEMKDKKQRQSNMSKMHTVEGQAASLAAQFEDLELDDIPMVKLGDASIAAPFTSKMPSIRSCADIVKQGRCTLVTSMQMYQILALNCLISSYSLSVLYLDGVKYGDAQMTAMGMLGSISFMSVSRSKPLDRLSPVKPLTSIFHPSMFLSLLGQFSVHLVIMMLAVRGAKSFLPPDYEPDLDGEFKPGILNSVVFLVSNVQQVTVFVVNLQGRPFMTGLTENRPLLWSLVATFILTFMFASESVPGLNKYFQLVPFPDEEFRNYLLKLLAMDVGLTILVDRGMKLLFCPDILFASVKGTTVKDLFSLARTTITILIIMYVLLGNDETWEEMLRQEAEMAEELLDGSVGLVNTTIAESIMLDEL